MSCHPVAVLLWPSDIRSSAASSSELGPHHSTALWPWGKLWASRSSPVWLLSVLSLVIDRGLSFNPGSDLSSGPSTRVFPFPHHPSPSQYLHYKSLQPLIAKVALSFTVPTCEPHQTTSTKPCKSPRGSPSAPGTHCPQQRGIHQVRCTQGMELIAERPPSPTAGVPWKNKTQSCN